VLHVHRERSFWFGYLHIPVYAAIVATGAGLHTAAYYVEQHSELGSVGTVVSVVIPVAVYVGLIYLLYTLMVRTRDVFHVVLIALTAVVLAAAVLLAMAGVPMAVCLLVATLAPVVSVVGFEVLGHRHIDEAIAADLTDGT